MKTPDYVLMEDFSYGTLMNEKIVEKGSFVRPIEDCYVPKHCFDSMYAMRYNKYKEVFCYGSFGLMPIPRAIIRKVE